MASVVAAALAVLTLAIAAVTPDAAVAATRATAATASWQPVKPPWPAGSPVLDISAFGPGGIAVAGDGRIAVSRDGGRSWTVTTPSGMSGAVFSAVAVRSSGRGVAASGGLLLVTNDGGATWNQATYSGPAPGTAFNDVDVSGARAVAVGEDGSIFGSADGGTTWQQEASPTTSAITRVALAGDGTAVAGSAAGEILVFSGGVWTLAGGVQGAVTSVAAAADPVWGDGRPDLFVATGRTVVAGDGAGFAPLPGLPDLSAGNWVVVAWVGTPEPSLLLAGEAGAGVSRPLGGGWSAAPTGQAGAVAADVAPGQSVVYLLGSDGRVVRSLSAGAGPALIQLPKRIATGQRARLVAEVRVGAPGRLQVQQRVPGGSWRPLRTLTWSAADWGRTVAVDVAPTLSREYRLQLRYGRQMVQIGAASLVVAPRVSVSRSVLRLRVGDVYRFTGNVRPRLRGARIVLYTDRGGSWRPVSKQSHVTVRDGRTWQSRRFGTPTAERYRLRARVQAGSRYGSAWSPVVTVVVR